jgi:hypothetical protein
MENQSIVHDLSINKKNKLIWRGSFEALQQFVLEVLDLSAGKWSSPGADARLFLAAEKDIPVKWYARSQTLLLLSSERIELRLKTD